MVLNELFTISFAKIMAVLSEEFNYCNKTWAVLKILITTTLKAMHVWQSRVENEHYSGCKLLRKMRLKLGVILTTFAFEPISLSSVILLLPDPPR